MTGICPLTPPLRAERFTFGIDSNVVLHTASVRETLRIGKLLGRRLLPGDVIALVGDLGTGKTCFIKGVAQGAGVRNSAGVSSPSFTLIQEYAGRIPLYHIDLYRLEHEEEAWELGLEEVMKGGGITAIEWAERIPSLLPEDLLRINIHSTGVKTRSIEITASGDRYAGLLRELRNADFG